MGGGTRPPMAIGAEPAQGVLGKTERPAGRLLWESAVDLPVFRAAQEVVCGHAEVVRQLQQHQRRYVDPPRLNILVMALRFIQKKRHFFLCQLFLFSQ